MSTKYNTTRFKIRALEYGVFCLTKDKVTGYKNRPFE